MTPRPHGAFSVPSYILSTWFVCGEAECGWSGVRKFEELKPDVVILDLSMPDISVSKLQNG
jgi:DNA-binding NarL/FixJ family response regulator